MKTIVFLIGVDVLGFPILHKHHILEKRNPITGVHSEFDFDVISETITLK